MAVPVTPTDALVSVALFFFGLSFITLGAMALGKGEAEGAAPVFSMVGVIEAVLGFIILAANLGNAVYISVALLILIFAFTWIVAGYVNARDLGLMPLGNASILSGLMMLGFAAFFTINSELFTAAGWIWLTVNVLSWAWAFWSVTLVSYERIDFSVVGWTFLVEAFYTLWIPAVLLLTGAFSLLA